MMQRDSSSESGYLSESDLVFRQQEETVRKSSSKDERVVPRPGYLVELCGEPIPLELIEFRILKFLATNLTRPIRGGKSPKRSGPRNTP